MEERMRTCLTVVTALALAAQTGCHSTPAPIPPETAWTMRLAAEPSGQCTFAGVDATFGTVTASSVTPIAGEFGDNVSEFTDCSVVEMDAGTFTVQTLTEAGNPHGTYFSVAIDRISASATEASPASGVVELAGPAIGGQTLMGNCSFYFKDPGPTGEGVDKGKLWCAYTCTNLTTQGAGLPEACQVLESYLFFQNCGTYPPTAL
jgi:hypothetical protein